MRALVSAAPPDDVLVGAPPSPAAAAACDTRSCHRACLAHFRAAAAGTLRGRPARIQQLTAQSRLDSTMPQVQFTDPAPTEGFRCSSSMSPGQDWSKTICGRHGHMNRLLKGAPARQGLPIGRRVSSARFCMPSWQTCEGGLHRQPEGMQAAAQVRLRPLLRCSSEVQPRQPALGSDAPPRTWRNTPLHSCPKPWLLLPARSWVAKGPPLPDMPAASHIAIR
jgi:hypothetical protein